MRFLKDVVFVFLGIMLVMNLARIKVSHAQHMGIFPAHKGMDNHWSCPDTAIAVQPYDQDPNPWPFFFIPYDDNKQGRPFNSFPGSNGDQEGYWMYMTPNIVPPVCVAKD